MIFARGITNNGSRHHYIHSAT